VKRAYVVRVTGGVVAAGLVLLSAVLPLWTMTMTAPQYRHGLHLKAYGTGMQGDLRELNIINHYIGMATIDPRPALEVAMFPIGIGLVAGLCLLAPMHRWLRRLALTAAIAMPVGILVDLQWWLYRFGHSLDPKAPIRMPPFTPLILGVSKLGNFVTTSTISTGVLCMVAAAIVLAISERVARGGRRDGARRTAAPAIAAALAGVFMLGSAWPAQAAATLQQRIDGTAPGGTLVVDGGVHLGAIVVRGPITIVGINRPVIDGKGSGSVVTIEGDGVVFRGFLVRNSGRQVTEEAAGIAITGNHHAIEDTDIVDVYFGIHIAGGTDIVVQDNRIAPGELHGARPGHGLSIWNAQHTRVLRNHISDARDGIYLSFTDGVLAQWNEITRCRYAIHSMYSQRAQILDNHLTKNLLGAALMLSDRLELRRNRIEQHREGSSAYAVLLKDIDNLDATGNRLVGNRVGIYAEGVAVQASSRARLTDNVIAGNEVGIALQSNAAMTIVGNRLADNLTDVRMLGSRVSAATRWSEHGRGNWWSEYKGYDANDDGVGDIPFRVDGVMDAVLQRTPLAQAFLYTPAHLALEAAARMFPLSRREPVLVDAAPLMRGGR
jgi:nitrous oxidase accessory protein